MFTRNRRLAIVLFLVLGCLVAVRPVQVSRAAGIEISAPANGDALQGVVSILGTTDIDGFQSAEISFGYQDDSTSTWFLIDQNTRPVEEDVLAGWDTSTITDGEYRLRLQVFLNGGQVLETVVENLRVRNYTPVETSTPDPRAQDRDTPVPTQTPRPDYQANLTLPTPLPTNPAELTQADLQISALQGVAVVLAALLAAGLYWGLRTILHR